MANTQAQNALSIVQGLQARVQNGGNVPDTEFKLALLTAVQLVALAANATTPSSTNIGEFASITPLQTPAIVTPTL